MHTQNYHNYKEKRKHGNIQFPFAISAILILYGLLRKNLGRLQENAESCLSKISGCKK